MWNGGYPGQQHRQQQGGWNQGYQNRNFAPPPGPPGPPGPGFPSPQGGGYGGYGAPPEPQFRSGYNPSYAPPPGPPPGGYGGGDGGYGGGGYRGYNEGGNNYGPPSGPPPGPPPVPNYNSYPNAPAPHMPPTEVQNYGPHFQGPGNRDAQPFFQYSQCTGKKRALLIGINYFGQNGELKGCINDVNNLKRFLISQFGYQEDDMVILTDDLPNPRQQPTKQNIMSAMQWLVRNAQPNDSLFFHYSGHGGQEKDTDGDEADGYDECIYPVDHESVGSLVDDIMHEIMVKPLPPGCRLTAIFDSCHSGSALDLPYIYSTEGKIKEPNLAAEAGMGLLSTVSSYARGDMGGVMQGVTGLFKTATGGSQKANEYAKQTRTSPADVIMWSGCKDSQTSADTVEAGSATGAMSFAFISSLSQKPQQTYQELLNNLRGILRDKYSQKPQLSSSHPMDTDVYFIA